MPQKWVKGMEHIHDAQGCQILAAQVWCLSRVIRWEGWAAAKRQWGKKHTTIHQRMHCQ